MCATRHALTQSDWRSANIAPGQRPPFTKTNVYNHPTLDTGAPVVSNDGRAVVFGRKDDKLFLWEAATGGVRELASGIVDSTGGAPYPCRLSTP